MFFANLKVRAEEETASELRMVFSPHPSDGFVFEQARDPTA